MENAQKTQPRILWLHTQPEHYFNCMMDELAVGGDAEYIAAFAGQGPGLYRELPRPKVARSVFLKMRPGADRENIPMRRRVHVDWKQDLLPLDYDAVIVSGYAGRTQRAVIRDAHRRGIPVALWSDSNLRSQRGRSLKSRCRRWIKKRLLKPIIGQVDLNLTANRRGIAYWRYYGAPRQKILLVPYYADYPRIEAACLLPREQVLASVGLKSADRIIYTAARLVPVKGLDLAIKAFIEGGLKDKGWHFVIAGTGPLEADLKALAGPAEGSAIRFLGFQQPEVNLALMSHADLFVLPSRYEPHGIVVAEAMAAGTPVLASNVVGAAGDLVRPGVSGALFKTEDAEDLKRHLLKLTDDPRTLAAMRAGTRQVFEQWFNATSPIRVIPSVVRRLLQSKDRSAGGTAAS